MGRARDPVGGRDPRLCSDADARYPAVRTLSAEPPGGDPGRGLHVDLQGRLWHRSRVREHLLLQPAWVPMCLGCVLRQRVQLDCVELRGRQSAVRRLLRVSHSA